MNRIPSAAREQKKKDCEHLGRLPAIIGNTARGASQAKPVNTPTATVDDEHGYFLIGHVCNERRELTSGSESTQSIVKFFQKPPWMMQNMYPWSNEALRAPSSTATAEHHSFLRAPTRATVAAQQQAHKQPSKNCTCESPRSAAQCALCVPRSAYSWNVHHSVDELKHTRVHEQRLLALMLHVHRDSTRWPVFVSRPGLAVEPHKL